MEEYFEEVDSEAKQKNQDIVDLKDKLATMKRELEAAKKRTSEERAIARAEAESTETARRNKRVLPSAPSRRRIAAPHPGLKPAVVAVDTAAMDREMLIEELRSLESELEWVPPFPCPAYA